MNSSQYFSKLPESRDGPHYLFCERATLLFASEFFETFRKPSELFLEDEREAENSSCSRFET